MSCKNPRKNFYYYYHPLLDIHRDVPTDRLREDPFSFDVFHIGALIQKNELPVQEFGEM